jgi:hypothetical protein
VFVDDFASGVTFSDYGGGPTNDVSRDTTTVRNGHASLKVVQPASNWTGGALVAAAPMDLHAYNALSFWAKAASAETFEHIGYGDPNSGFTGQIVETHSTALTTTWTQYYVAVPVPTALTSSQGLFFFADGANHSNTVWFNDIQYVALDSATYTSTFGAVTQLSTNWQSPSLGAGSTYQLDFAPNTVQYGIGPNLYRVGWNYFTIASSHPEVATVDANGLVTGLDGGTSTITATLGSSPMPGSGTVTVTKGCGATAPSTAAADPGARLPADVVSLHTSSGVYTSRPVDQWLTSWSGTASEGDYLIAGPGRTVKRYVGLDFAGIEFLNPGPHLDVTGMTTMHVDLWTANATQFSVKLVDWNGTALGAAVQVDHAGLSQCQWVPLEIPLSSFTAIGPIFGQLLWADNTPVVEHGTFFLDNIYFHK